MHPCVNFSETHKAQINTTELINFVSSGGYKPDECKHTNNYKSAVKKIDEGIDLHIGRACEDLTALRKYA